LRPQETSDALSLRAEGRLLLYAPFLRPPYNRAMTRISPLDKDHVDAETKAIYDVYLKERGNVPNMFRTAAHRPEIFRTMIAHFRAVMNTGTVPAKLKELVIVRTSQINRCEY
jgi:alkylhydroperoxidase family enzyme